jgi:hypothetical protein
MIDDRFIAEVAEGMTRPMMRDETPRRQLTGKERSQMYAQEVEQRLAVNRFVADVPQAVASQMLEPRKELSAGDIEKMRAAERKRYRKRNRGW